MTRRSVAMIAILAFSGFISYSGSPCFTAGDFSANRDRLLAEISDGVVVLDAATFPSEFFYLTGVQSRDAKLILVPEQMTKQSPNPGAWKTTLYLPTKSPRSGVWDDPQLSYGDDTATPTGISANAPISSFWADVAKLGNITETIYVPFRPSGDGGDPLPADLQFVERLKRVSPSLKIKNLAPVLEQLRWVKSAKEIEIMRHACVITTDALKEAARCTHPGLYEYEIEAVVNYVFRREGSQRPAFMIIGSGPNSCVLHHSSNDRQMKENELLVVDIGTVFCSISTDLTRTIPVSGTFTTEQRNIYNIVLQAQKKAIAMVKPGVTLAQVHEAAYQVIADAGYGKYFIHGTSHTLNGGTPVNPMTDGLYYPQQNDRRYYANDVLLSAGSMFTIEPGIYIPEKNLGIRIEDDILVTKDGCEVLTAAAPKEIDEIEGLMREERNYIKK